MWSSRIMHSMTLIFLGFLVASSVIVQMQITSFGDAMALIRNAPDDVRGWYGEEYSETLPAAQGSIVAHYRWSYDQAYINIMPVPAGMRLLTVTYLNPFGNVDVFQNQQQVAQLTPSEQLRTSHMLLPSALAFDIMFVQSQPQRIEQRTLGFLVISMDWHAWNNISMVATLQQWLFSIWTGLPLVTLLFIGIGWWWTPNRLYRALLAALPLVGTVLVSAWSLWYANTVQSLWRYIAVIGICVLFIDRGLQQTPTDDVQL